MDIRDFIAWFSGGRDGYMTLVHCMNHDYAWITVTVILDFTIAIGYVGIALHWRRNELLLRDSPAKAALADMKRIFIFCGICGYLFIPIKMFWPAWRLYDLFLLVLVYFTWSYVLKSRGLSVVYRDLGRSEQLASDLLRSRDESRRKSEFFNAISHDMKTPLHGLMLQTELAAVHLECGEPDAVLETLEQMRSCLRTTTSLLNHFLEVGRLDVLDNSLHEEGFAVDDALKSIIAQFALRAGEKGLSIEFLGKPGARIVTDRVMLERILINLIDNAIKYTNQGSIQVRVVSRESTLAIEVIDTGEGISPENQSKIFDDFVQLDNKERDSRKGFGLGLSISKRLASLIGATLSLTSEPNVGSRFSIELPFRSSSVPVKG